MLWKAALLLLVATASSVPEVTMSAASKPEVSLKPAEKAPAVSLNAGAAPPPKCQAGQYVSSKGTCTSCPMGSYAPAANSASSCTTCPRGTSTKLPGSTSSSDCVRCPTGYYRSPTSGAVTPEDLRCIKCPSGQTTNAAGTGCVPAAPVKKAAAPLAAVSVDAGASGSVGSIGAAGSSIGAVEDPLKPKPNIIGMIIGGTAAILAVGCLIWHKKSTQDDEPWWEREYPFLKDDAPRHVRRALKHHTPPSAVF